MKIKMQLMERLFANNGKVIKLEVKDSPVDLISVMQRPKDVF